MVQNEDGKDSDEWEQVWTSLIPFSNPKLWTHNGQDMKSI
jgi:hypothetical protein